MWYLHRFALIVILPTISVGKVVFPWLPIRQYKKKKSRHGGDRSWERLIISLKREITDKPHVEWSCHVVEERLACIVVLSGLEFGMMMMVWPLSATLLEIRLHHHDSVKVIVYVVKTSKAPIKEKVKSSLISEFPSVMRKTIGKHIYSFPSLGYRRSASLCCICITQIHRSSNPWQHI